MGAIMESVFCIAYLIVTACLGVVIIRKDKLFGALKLTLVGGDAFHLVPRIYGNLAGKMKTVLDKDKMHTPCDFGQVSVIN